MEGTLNLTQAEACEAVRAYLQMRGALPAHGKVLAVGKDDANRYGASESVKVTIEIGEPPAPPPALAPADGKGA